MGRPKKTGLDYFPVDTDIFEDFGVKILMARFGSDGFTLYMYILSRAYKDKGYYIIENEDLEFIISKDLSMSREKVRQIMTYLFSRSLLVRIADGKSSTLVVPVTIITSTGIQKRYQEAVKERASKNPVEVKAEFWLLKKEETKSFIKVLPKIDKSEKKPSFSGKNESYSGEKSLKKSKVKNNIDIYTPSAVTYLSDQEANKEFELYLDKRRSDGMRLDDHQINGLIKKLLELSGDPKEQVKIIRESTIHGWKSFFPLPEKKKRERAAPSRPSGQKKNSFNDFEQRQYGRELENELLAASGVIPKGIVEGAG